MGMLEGAKADSTFMERIITGDETYVYETQTSQSSVRGKNNPKLKKTRQRRSKIKVILIVN